MNTVRTIVQSLLYELKTRCISLWCDCRCMSVGRHPEDTPTSDHVVPSMCGRAAAVIER